MIKEPEVTPTTEEKEKIIQWMNEIIRENISPNFYGSIEVTFQNGKVSVVKLTETFKPPPERSTSTGPH